MKDPKDMTEEYVDLGPIDNSIPTGMPGVDQRGLMRIVEAILDTHRHAHTPGTWEREAYEASIGAVLRVHDDADVRRHGWAKQRAHEHEMRNLDAARRSTPPPGGAK